MEFDPVFIKGLKLLQSNTKESLEQLRQLYYDAVGKRRVPEKKVKYSDVYCSLFHVSFVH